MQPQTECKLQDLRDVEIFDGLDAENMEKIRAFCVPNNYDGGEYIGVQGEHTDELLIVNSGKVAIEMRIEVPPYKQKLMVANLTKGQVCSWSALVDPFILTASIRCVEPSKIISVDALDLQRAFHENSKIELVVMRNLTKVIANRLRDSQTQFMNLVAEMIKQGHW